MKGFAVMLVIFMLMTGVLIVNYIYINNVADRLYAMTSQVPGIGEEGCYKQLSLIDEYWQNNHDTVGLSVSFIELNRVSDGITAMKSYAISGDSTQLECTRELLLNAIHEMSRLEAFTIGNIL